MPQSNLIFGALAVAFVVFITTRGSLPVYMSVLFGTAKTQSDNKPAENSAPSTANDAMGQAQDWLFGGIGNFLGSQFKRIEK